MNAPKQNEYFSKLIAKICSNTEYNTDEVKAMFYFFKAVQGHKLNRLHKKTINRMMTDTAFQTKFLAIFNDAVTMLFLFNSSDLISSMQDVLQQLKRERSQRDNEFMNQLIVQQRPKAKAWETLEFCFTN